MSRREFGDPARAGTIRRFRNVLGFRASGCSIMTRIVPQDKGANSGPP